jgi:hypothetical protein
VSAKTIKGFAAVLASFMLAGCGIPAGLLMWWQATHYSGEGKIQTCSQWFGAGYRVDFAAFDASRPFAASYRVSALPHVSGRDPMIYLKFNVDEFLTNSDAIKSETTASFGIDLLGSDGRLIQMADLQAATTIWWGGGKEWGMYDLYKSKFHFDRRKTYIVRVWYEPGRVPPPANQLYFSIDNCAYK